MYEPPMRLIGDDLVSEIADNLNRQFDEYVLKVVWSYGIDVDKRELVRALSYDREQYEKGYRDGREEGIAWTPISSGMPPANDYYLTTTEYGEVYLDYYDGHDFGRSEYVIAYAPRPKPYKEE